MHSFSSLKSDTNRNPLEDPSLFTPGLRRTSIGAVKVDSERRINP